MTEFFAYISVATVIVAVSTVLRGVRAYRERTAWVARPKLVRIAEREIDADLRPIVDAAAERLRALGYEPPVCFRTRAGLAGARSTFQYHIVHLHPSRCESAYIAWAQWGGRGPASQSAMRLRLYQRQTDAAYEYVDRLLATWRSADGRADYGPVIGPDDIAATRVALADGRGTGVQRAWPFGDDMGLPARLELFMRAAIAQRASEQGFELDRDDAHYRPTRWTALVIVVRHWLGLARPAGDRRGFDVIRPRSEGGPEGGE